MATVAQIRADLVGSSASFRAAMVDGAREANTQLSAIRREVQSTASSITTLNKAAASFVGFEAVKAGVANLLEAQKAIQQIHYSLLSATGSSTAADAAYQAVSATAEKLGLDLQTSALGFASMSAAANANGVSMKDQLALFDGLARSSSVLHLSADQTGRAITALSQIFGKGRIQAEELRGQLGDAIPGVVPRFQAAVMAMTQGTDLAGKSFDQLLQSGDVTVQRFLPALVQALNDTGRGAEQAAGGLNASINRLSSQWFKLKADLSGGLFSDAAIASIDLVSHNLQNLANVAGVTGGLVAARLAGTGASKAAGGVTAFVQQEQEARAAALATREVAEQNAAAAAAEARHNQVAITGVATARQQALAQREAAQALYQKALAENEAAQATLMHQRTAATLSMNIRAEREAAAQAAAAETNLARARTQYNAAIVAGNTLKQEQIALEARQIELQAAEIVQQEALAAAQAKVNATGVGGLLARGAAGVGNFALSLVGGPWGAAVAAIGAVGYAIYETQKRSEEYRKETDEQVKSLQQMRDQVQAAARDYGTLHAAMGTAQSLQLYSDSSDALRKQRDEIAQLEQQAAQLQDRINARSASGAGGGAAVADWFDERKLAEVRDRIKELSDQLPATQANVDALGTKLAGTFAPSIEAVKGAIDRLRAGAELGSILSGWSADINNAIQNVDAARAKSKQLGDELAANAQQLTKQAATVGMNNAQQQQYLLRQQIEQIRAQRLSPDAERDQIAEASRTAAGAIQAGAQKDAADAAKKAAEQAQSQARQWKQQADSLNQSLQQTHNELTAQLDSTQRLTPAEKQLQDIVGGTNDAYNHASAALKTKMLAQAQANAELSKSILLQQQETAAAARSAALQDQLAARIQRQTEANAIATASVGHGQQLTQQLQDELRIRQEYDRQRQQYDREAGKLAAGTAGSIGSSQYNDDVARMQASQQQELAIYRAGVQQRLEAEQDWRNGAQAAIEDYAASAANAAAQTQQVFSNAFGELEDDLVKGKLNFTSFANSVIADMLRIQVRSGLSGLAQYGSQAIGSLFGYDATGGAGTSSYNSMGAVTHVNFGGGRATGGSTAGGTLYEVAERGPELYQSGGRTYLLSGRDGYVTPAAAGGGAGYAGGTATGGLVVNITNNTGAQVTAKQSTGPGGMPTLDVLIDMVDTGLANRVDAGKSRTGNAIARRTGANMANNL